MSINGKNLSYEVNEPAFLRRLRGEHGGGDSTRHERPLVRPTKQIRDGGEDDQPAYVVEGSQDTLSKAQYDALVKEKEEQDGLRTPLPDQVGENESPTRITDEGDMSPAYTPPANQRIAAIGVSNKRRIAKIVGEDDEDRKRSAYGDPTQQVKKPKVKRGKKVKLSFDEDPAKA